MVKNGDLIDVEPDGSITVAGKAVGGGSDYIAGSNIQISETKEISVNPELTGIEKIKLAPSNDYEISRDDNRMLISKNVNSGGDLVEIKLKSVKYKTFLRLLFDYNKSFYQNIRISADNVTDGSQVYAFLTRSGSVPMVSNEEGTYLLKATVDKYGLPSYRWEKQQ